MGVILSNSWSSLNVKIKNKSTNKNASLSFNFHFFSGDMILEKAEKVTWAM